MNQRAYSNADNLGLAIAAIIFTVFALSLGDAIIKQVSADFPLWQIFVIRSIIAIPILFVIIKARFQSVSLMPRDLKWTALRSIMLTFMWVAYYLALPHVVLSVAAAVFYTLPLFITLFAAFFINERVGVRGWIAVFLGFIGIILILKPQAADFNPYALLPLASAILYAFAMIITRTKCKFESPLTLSFGLNVSMIVTGGIASLLIWLLEPSNLQVETNSFLLGEWLSMGAGEWLFMGLLATSIIIGSIFAAYAYQNAPSSIVSTFDFLYLAFAVLWGIIFFAEIPDAISMAGIFLIASGGILAVRR
ncbi:MAG: DMT family transporter [Rhodospirillales bacterium]|jgi:drug/metabolite transporter (DMT)-like permease|nr:DMT family transporter [Rhodospirillales bacterium]